jgi:hypothetical protein
MSSTSTNKQPLLIDRVFHEVYEMATQTILTTKVTGTNFAQKILDCTTNDGAMIEDIYVISQGSGTENGIPVEYAINLYLTTDSDFLRDNARFVGQIEASTTPNDWTHLSNMPYVLAPVAQVGSEPQLKAFYVPKGKALWAARQTSNLTDNISNAPLLGVSGGFF